jgi:hypothetical protein
MKSRYTAIFSTDCGVANGIAECCNEHGTIECRPTRETADLKLSKARGGDYGHDRKAEKLRRAI